MVYCYNGGFGMTPWCVIHVATIGEGLAATKQQTLHETLTVTNNMMKRLDGTFCVGVVHLQT